MGITFGVFALGALLQFWLNLRNGGSVISSGYQSQVFNGSALEKAGQMWVNLLGYLNETVAGSLVPVFGDKVTALVGVLVPLLLNAGILILIMWGWMLAGKKFHLMDLYFVIYLAGILAFWNPKVGSVKARFLIPMIPFLYFYFVFGLRWVVERFAKNSARILILTAGLILLLLVGRSLQDWRNPVRAQMTDLSIGAGWVAENAPADAIIMVNEPVPVYVQMRRQTVAYPKDLENIESYVINQGIDYIIVSPKLQSPRSEKLDKDVETQLLPILNASPDMFSIVYQDLENNVTVYQFMEK